jgi:hypothetical protein
MTRTVARRRMPTDDRHRCWPRTVLLLERRRAIRFEPRRGFALSPRYICLRCGVTARSPKMLCAPEPIDQCSLCCGYRQACQGDKAPSAVSRVLPWGPCSPWPGSMLGTIPEGRGYPDTLELG